MLLTVRQAARQANMTPQGIYHAMDWGTLRRTEIAGRLFVDDTDLKVYMASAKNKGGRPRSRPRALPDS